MGALPVACRIDRIRPFQLPAVDDFLASQNMLEVETGNPDLLLWAARDEEEGLLAMVGVSYDCPKGPSAALIRPVVVAPAVRGMGYGRALVEFALAEAAAAGALTAWSLGIRVVPFWQALGFRRAGCDELPAFVSCASPLKSSAKTGCAGEVVAWKQRLRVLNNLC